MAAPSGAAAGAEARGEELLRRGLRCVEEFDYQGGVAALQAALEARPSHTPTLDALGAALLEVGAVDAAVPLLERSAQLEPDRGATKWMTLGQLSEGAEAAARFRKGLAVIDAELAGLRAAAAAGDAAAAARARALQREGSTALCSLAELYTTDLCFEDGAEAECERLLQLAVGTDAGNPEAFHALVNLRLIQGRRDDAARYLERCVRLLDGAADRGEASQDGVELLMNVAKAAFELAQYEVTVRLLEDALEQDAGAAVDAHYLIAFAYHRLERRAAALEHLGEVMRHLASSQDEEMSAAAAELLAEVRASTYQDRGLAEQKDDADME